MAGPGRLLMDKKVLVVGFGVEGKSLTEYFLKQGAKVTIADQKTIAELPADEVELFSSKGVGWRSGESYLDSLVDFDLIAFSPGVKYPTYQKIINSGVPYTTQMQLFFENTPTKNLIGVTGTKGKGTTSALIYEILKASGKNVYLGGNIGTGVLPLLDNLKPDDWVVLELSSYQLRDLKISPHIGVILNITPDHMDVHSDFDDYVGSKANIIRYQNEDDYALLNDEYEVTKKLAELTKARVEYFNKTDFAETGYQLNIPGKHNWENAAAAMKVADLLGIDQEIVNEILANFKGLPHRLEEVAVIDGVRYIDDSFATSPSPTIVGIEAFSEPKILILGGSGKIEDFSDLVNTIMNNSTIKSIITIGKSGVMVKQQLAEVGFSKVISGLPNIEEVVKEAKEIAESGDVVLLSPADASFDWFKNYTDRGEKFAEAVKKLDRV